METRFPAPFGGITTAVRVPRGQLRPVVDELAAGCGLLHQHNLAIQFDDSVIWVSSLGAHCIERLMRERAKDEPRDRIRRRLRRVRDYARAKIPTEPDHALFPNHRADEALRDALEHVLHEATP